ncbi:MULTISPECIES: hypothetical protein [unclassified Sinorhizobium]|uniref:hypothetical protein n=1 Tax=unclassified Sinorhizobium TaxID=2613772 RepID=UPI003523A457
MKHRKNEGPLDIKENNVNRQGELDSTTRHKKVVEGDDVANLKAMKEAARERGDAFVVKSDLEDEDQREASPGTREQD